MITVLRAPPFATVQDLGRTGHLDAAVPRAGALDFLALALANILVGNGANSAAVEWGLAGGEVRFERDATIAITGARARAALGGQPVPYCEAVRAAAGEVLAIERIEAGAWVYLAVGGGINVREVLGSRSTYLPARFGGMEGRLLRAGDHLPIGRPSTGPLPVEPATSIPSQRKATAELADPRPADPIAVLPGPDLGLLRGGAWHWLVETEFRVSRAVSRMGYTLEAPPPAFPLPGDLPSAPACVGTVQLPPGGEPIVLMPDGPTVGGYPRVAVVASLDLGRLAQRSPGEAVRFREIGLREARAGLQRRWTLLERVAESA
jgi:biotin-dependent carboxylase-like uncharacterized protein